MTSATGRSDYDARFKFDSIPADEPRFLLRAQDVAAPRAVRAWAEFAHEAGTPPATLEMALQQADAMEAWPTKKVASVDDLPEPRRLQLEYQLGRRARTWAIGAQGDAATALAHQVGWADGVGAGRHAIDLLRELLKIVDTAEYRAKVRKEDRARFEHTVRMGQEFGARVVTSGYLQVLPLQPRPHAAEAQADA